MNHTNPFIKFLPFLGLVCAVVVLGDALMQAGAHLHDLSHINHIAGIWMTLAQQLRAGVFYPPLEQDGYYAGTRYMPLFFVLVAGLSKLTGDYLFAAKLACLLSMLGVLAAVFAATRSITGRYRDALLLAAAIFAFPEARRALLSPHADALAVAFSVAGLALLSGGRRFPFLATAAVLFALALGTKITSVAGCAAAGVYFFRAERRPALLLAALTMGLGIVGFVLLQVSSEGRFLENFRAVGSGGLSAERLLDGPVRFLLALVVSTKQNYVTPLLLGPALFTVLRNALERRLSLWDWYFLFTLAVTIFIFTSPGTDPNHLLELEVGSILVLASWLRSPFEMPGLGVRGFVTVALLMGMAYAGLIWLAGATPAAISEGTLIAALPQEGELLTEDATPAVLLGRRPVVMDPFAYRLLVERGRVDPTPLADRVRRREFRALVLLRRIEIPEESLAPRIHFGPQLTNAIVESYRFERQVGDYYLYVAKVDSR